MDNKFIKPSVFDIDPNSQQASKEWRHMYCTLLNFLDFFSTKPAISNKDRLKLLALCMAPPALSCKSGG